MSDNLDLVETACTELADNGAVITFTAIATHTGISRTTLYRNPQLRAVIEDHRSHSHDRRTLTGLAAESHQYLLVFLIPGQDLTLEDSGPGTAVDTAGLVAHYTFDEGSEIDRIMKENR